MDCPFEYTKKDDLDQSAQVVKMLRKQQPPNSWFADTKLLFRRVPRSLNGDTSRLIRVLDHFGEPPEIVVIRIRTDVPQLIAPVQLASSLNSGN